MMRSAVRTLFVVSMLVASGGALESRATAQCPPATAFGGGYVGGYSPGFYPQSYSLPPGVIDSSQFGGYVSSPFAGPVAGMRCRVICYPVTTFAPAGYSGGQYASVPGYSTYPVMGGNGYGGLPYGGFPGRSIQFSYNGQ